METSNRYAFKEWAVVCEALRTGRQSIILRKGGIHEGHEGFRVEHREFWLFPTEFHQQPDVITAEARSLLTDVSSRGQSANEVVIRDYVVVDEVLELRDESVLPRLSGLHIWSEQTLHARFHYKTPGLYALLVRVYSFSTEVRIPQSSHFAGCRSWIDLSVEIETATLEPVISEEIHREQMQVIHHRLGI